MNKFINSIKELYDKVDQDMTYYYICKLKDKIYDGEIHLYHGIVILRLGDLSFFHVIKEIDLCQNQISSFRLLDINQYSEYRKKFKL